MSIISEVFTPRWASSPGATLGDILEERRITVAQLATVMNLPRRTVEELLHGKQVITVDLADKLAENVGATSDFWLAREAQYREDLRRAEADKWAEGLPVRQMAAMSWIPKPSDWKERLRSCMQFFQLVNVGDWSTISRPIIQSSYFRSSASSEADPNTVLAWLRQGEIATADQEVARWDPEAFDGALRKARALTREKDPSKFLPVLTELCMGSGVRFAIVRAPHGCPVSGVARFINGTSPMIVLSARHLSDDQLWFTFFHEAGHLILHDTGNVYLDDDLQLDGGVADSADEVEANDFAERLLVPHDHGIKASRWLSHRDVIRKAQELGIGPGVLVGQLQHQGIIGFDTLNRLKRRYRWVGSSLEKA
ncbi:ImmA/IrrE family metallo-endopeptidase [Micromonospora sp. NPDC004704]